MSEWTLTDGDILLLFGAHKQTYDEFWHKLQKAVGHRAHELHSKEFEKFIVSCANRLASEELLTMERRDGVGYYWLTDLGLVLRKELLQTEEEYPLEPWDFLTPMQAAR